MSLKSSGNEIEWIIANYLMLLSSRANSKPFCWPWVDLEFYEGVSTAVAASLAVFAAARIASLSLAVSTALTLPGT